MPRDGLEVADIFRAAGPAWRRAQAGHLSLGQLKVMSAIERCRTAALGGHVAACEDCGHIQVAYNSCRNRHCPKCQGAAAKEWLAVREAELLPVAYYHVIFTLPLQVADIAYQNKAVVYDMLFKAAAETLITIAADPKHLGARIGLTAVLHTWARLFRRLFLEKLAAAHAAGRLHFFNDLAALAEPEPFAAHLAPLRRIDWVVYAKAPFAGPEAVLAYLSRYTHRVAISNSRLIAFDDESVTFKWKDYRASGRERHKLMTLATEEFIRRFLLHVLPKGFHRIRHYGLFANGGRADNLARARELLDVEAPTQVTGAGSEEQERQTCTRPCPNCGGPMIVIETFAPGAAPSCHRTRAPPPGQAAKP
jgi:predicted Zn-ribbon and HTH transcriptional regulator